MMVGSPFDLEMAMTQQREVAADEREEFIARWRNAGPPDTYTGGPKRGFVLEPHPETFAPRIREIETGLWIGLVAQE